MNNCCLSLGNIYIEYNLYYISNNLSVQANILMVKAGAYAQARLEADEQ